MKRNLFFCWLFAILGLPMFANADKVERKQLLDADWHFMLGDAPDAASPALDDAAWRKLDLPHDWSIESDFDEKAPAGSDGGYLPTGIGWYRKTFYADKTLQGKTLRLYFEGAYMNSEVFQRRASGWTSLRLFFFLLRYHYLPAFRAGECGGCPGG